MNIKNNRFLPFIIIFILLVLLGIMNIITSKTDKEYKKTDIIFNFEDSTEDSSETLSSTEFDTETQDYSNTIDEEYENNELDIIDNEDILEETNEGTLEETNEDILEETTEGNTISNLDNEIEDDIDEPILFNSNVFLENTALGYFNQTIKFRQFFVSKEVFESRDELPLNDIKIISSDLKNNTVTISYIPDGDSNDRETCNLKFMIENNKIVDVIME